MAGLGLLFCLLKQDVQRKAGGQDPTRVVPLIPGPRLQGPVAAHPGCSGGDEAARGALGLAPLALLFFL